MSEKTREENQNKIEETQGTGNIPNSPKQKIIITNISNNPIINNDYLNFSIDNQNLIKITKELENIALTGETKYSWNELKPYIIYFYEKNVKNFSINKKNSMDLSYLNSGEISFPFSDKKEIKEEQMDLNNSHEHNILEEKNLNLDGDFNLSDENHFADEVIRMNKVNNKNNIDEDIEKDILEFINKINSIPFTIQRIAELLLDPKKYYSSLAKYNRAFYKLVNIDFD